MSEIQKDEAKEIHTMTQHNETSENERQNLVKAAREKQHMEKGNSNGSGLLIRKHGIQKELEKCFSNAEIKGMITQNLIPSPNIFQERKRKGRHSQRKQSLEKLLLIDLL